MKYLVGLKFKDEDYAIDFVNAKRKNELRLKYEIYNVENASNYKAVLIDDPKLKTVDTKCILFAKNEEDDNNIYKYLRYDEIDIIIENKIETVKAQKTNIICLIDNISTSKSYKYIENEIVNSRKSLFINLSYSTNKILNTDIDISKMLFYILSGNCEKEYFLKTLFEGECKYIDGFNSIDEMMELDINKINKLVKVLKTIKRYSYVYLILEPGVNKQIITMLENSNLFIFFENSKTRFDKYNNIIKNANQNIKTLIICDKKTSKKYRKSECLSPIFLEEGIRINKKVEKLYE